MVPKQSMKTKTRRRAHPRLRGLWIVIIGVIAVFTMLMAILVIVPAASPTTGAETADFLRSIFGPAPVAQLESFSYAMHDAINRSIPAFMQGRPQVSWSSSVPPEAQIPAATPSPVPTSLPASHALAPAATALAPQPMATPTPDAITAAPQIGWQAYAPYMARAIVMVDPERSYAAVALVRMDLSRLRLHIMAGFIEPAHPSGIDKIIPNLGMIPPQDQGSVAAAFNGGFKSIHGHYGMMVNGTTLLQPVNGMATVAVYKDGSVQMGAWGVDLFPSPDMVAFRQNCPPLIDTGQINPAVLSGASKGWGFTNNTDAAWRTGLGITADRRFLIYAVGNGTTAQFLAESMQKAGASMGMQLDVNQYYAHFVTYSKDPSSGSALIAEPLLDKMIDVHKLYLVPNPRDFFYVTVRE